MLGKKSDTIAALLEFGTTKLKTCSETPALDAQILLCSALGISKERLVIDLYNNIKGQDITLFVNLIEKRLSGWSVAHVIGKKSFWKSEFIVSEKTFAPRPDTETLISSILSCYKNKKENLKILEFGTGTGCIIASLIVEYKNAFGYGFEKSHDAYFITQKNIAAHKLQNRVKIFYGDFKQSIKFFKDVDIIVSNPPYIKKFNIDNLKDDVKNEPKIALDGGSTGILVYFDILKVAKKI